MLLLALAVTASNGQAPSRPERPGGAPARPAPGPRPGGPVRQDGTNSVPPRAVPPPRGVPPPNSQSPSRPSPQQTPGGRPVPQVPNGSTPPRAPVGGRPVPQQQPGGRRTTTGAPVETTKEETTVRVRDPPRENVIVPTLPNIANVPEIHFPGATEPSVNLPQPIPPNNDWRNPENRPWGQRPPNDGPWNQVHPQPPQTGPWRPQPPNDGPWNPVHPLPPQTDPWSPNPPQVRPPQPEPLPPNARLDPRCPINQNPNSPVHLPHTSDCSLFYKCDRGYAIEYNCPPGQHWNQRRDFCDFPHNANCQLTGGARPPNQIPNFPVRNPNPGFEHPIVIPMAPRS